MNGRRAVSRAALVLGGAGLVIGAVAAWLVSRGNPGNMGLCIACFGRDIAGAFGGAGFNMGAVAYIRPEIVGLTLGAMASALAGREFKPRGGSATLLRFVLGGVFMLASLVFLGCTVRAWLRLGGGDLSALAGLAGVVVGVGVGALLLRRRFDLGRARPLPAASGWVGPAIAAALLALALAAAFGVKPPLLTVTPPKAKTTAEKAVISADGAVLKPVGAKLVDGAVVASDGTVVSGAESVKAAKPLPGGLRAPFALSLVAGLGLGVLAQRSRFCTIGGLRDAILWRRFDLLLGIAGLVVGALAANVALGQFKLGFAGQPFAHADALGSFAAMSLAGLSALMLGGCPFRQVVMTGEGDADAGAAVAGMFAGALAAHRFGLVSTAAGLAPLAWPMLGVMAVVLAGIAWWKRDAEPKGAGAA